MITVELPHMLFPIQVLGRKQIKQKENNENKEGGWAYTRKVKLDLHRTWAYISRTELYHMVTSGCNGEEEI